MSSVRSRIQSIRDYESFLRARGFSRSEAKTLARAFKDLPAEKKGASRDAKGHG